MCEEKTNLSQEAVEKLVARIKTNLEMLPEKLRIEAGWRIIFECAMSCSRGMFEAIGLLEAVKLTLREMHKEVEEEEDDTSE